jgi:NADH-quinone oxidoreductase subunit G
MPKLTIDGQEIEVENGTVIIQAAEQLGIEIPRFCYHDRLAIAGNCRMCLVEVSPGPPKPQASCALPCAEGMVVKTNTPMVKKAREGVMEFLLINHPLDCPICDQAGECDLQDQSIAYGKGESRYKEHKRSVEDKYMGPLVSTFMNRCIHCTRCVRFITDVAGVPELGGLGRGEHMEIGTYVENAISSELSGNIVDLCPVGALTSKPYAYAARSWELTKTETIDVLDAVGCNIRVDSRGEAVLRVLPRVHEDINEEWISDKTRHACDGLKTQRLDRPYVRGADGKLKPASWEQALQTVAAKMKQLQPSEIAAVAGNLACTESMFALKSLMDAIEVKNLDCRQEGAKIPTAKRGDYLFNATIAGIEEADAIVLIGTNPRKEASLVNARIRKAWKNATLKEVFLLGVPAELTYPVTQLGNDPRVLKDLATGSHAAFAKISAAKKPMVIVGTGALSREDGAAIYETAKQLAEKIGASFNVLHHAASRVGGLDVGFVPAKGGRDMSGIVEGCKTGEVKLVYLLGVDEVDMAHFGKAFVVYQGHHGDIGAHRADVVFPAAAYTEKDATYVNLEGRVQRAVRAVFPVGEAKEDWAIIRALSGALGAALPFDSLSQLRAVMEKAHPHLAQVDAIAPSEVSPANPPKPGQAAILVKPFDDFVPNFYRTDPISRASKTMAECTKQFVESADKKVA